MPILGAHMSIAGGYFKAVEAAARANCDCVQVFTKNNNQWRAKPITPADEQRFTQCLAELQIGHPIAHSSYLINLASPDAELWKKSIDAMVVELCRAEQLSIPYVVVHPGAYTSSSESAGMRRIGQALNEIHQQTRSLQARVLLETTAGQGSNLGWRFEQLAGMYDATRAPERLGICFDTCHVFAAGYDLRQQRQYRSTIKQFDRVIGVDQIKAFHLNDSKRELGSRVDRHEHIGRGLIGRDGFRWLLTDRRFRSIPMYLETPKGEEKGRDLDAINIRLLRRLAKRTG